MATIAALWASYKIILLPILGFLIGWVFPSPLQQSNTNAQKAHDAVSKAEDSHGDLDRMA